MDLTTYEGLKTAVADYLGRSDLTERIPYFIRLAELRMQRDVRCRVMERTATSAVIGIAAAQGNDLLNYPDAMRQFLNAPDDRAFRTTIERV